MLVLFFSRVSPASCAYNHKANALRMYYVNVVLVDLRYTYLKSGLNTYNTHVQLYSLSCMHSL